MQPEKSRHGWPAQIQKRGEDHQAEQRARQAARRRQGVTVFQQVAAVPLQVIQQHGRGDDGGHAVPQEGDVVGREPFVRTIRANTVCALPWLTVNSPAPDTWGGAGFMACAAVHGRYNATRGKSISMPARLLKWLVSTFSATAATTSVICASLGPASRAAASLPSR